MVAQPIFMTKSAALAGAVDARQGNARLASAAAAAKSFPVIVPTLMLGRPHGSWCGDYSGPAGLAKGVAAHRDIPHLLIKAAFWAFQFSDITRGRDVAR